MKTFLTVVLLVGSTLGSQAQTAEETVAYIVLGLEDNASPSSAEFRNIPQFKVNITSRTPLVFSGKQTMEGGAESGTLNVSYTIKKEGDSPCIYSVESTGKIVISKSSGEKREENYRYKNIYDFNGISSYRITEHDRETRSIEFSGVKKECYLDNNGVLSKLDENFCKWNYTAGVQARVGAAISYLQKNFCVPKAF